MTADAQATGGDDYEDEPDRRRYRYDVLLYIDHPNIDPGAITEALGLAPYAAHRAGTPRKTPKGTPLDGVYRTTKWSHSAPAEGKRRFFQGVTQLVDILEPHAAFLSKIVETKGSIQLLVHLAGDVNIGDDMAWHELARLAALKIKLGVEVFPEYN